MSFVCVGISFLGIFCLFVCVGISFLRIFCVGIIGGGTVARTHCVLCMPKFTFSSVPATVPGIVEPTVLFLKK